MLLCCGEALIDMLPRETTQGEHAFAPYSGGAVFNTAIAAGRLGLPTGMFTGLSTDLFGQRLAQALDDNGVSCALSARSDSPTTLAFVTLTNGQASYAFYDENTAGQMLSEDDLPATLAGVEALFFGGISLVVEPCARAYEALCLRAAPDHLVMIDPNIRTGFIRDEAVYRARLDKMLAISDVVKLSDEDLAWLEGHDDLEKGAASVLAKGAKLALITQGADGVTAYWDGGSLFQSSERVEVIDTVGAGDTFNAGFLAGLSDAGLLSKNAVAAGLPEDALRAALALGSKAAAVTVSRAGANPPRRDELA